MTQDKKPKVPSALSQENVSGDDEAAKESSLFSSGQNLEDEANKAQHNRRENTRDHVGNVLIWSVYIGFFLILSAILIYSVHSFGPNSWRFLSLEEVNNLKNNLSHIILGIFAGFVIKNKFV